MTQFADLHIHTYFSDSTFSPQEVVQEAIAAGLNCISITDHDTLEGVEPTQQAASVVNLEVIAGVELSTEMDGKDIHILGYFPKGVGHRLVEELDEIQQARVERIQKMIQNLRGLGIKDIKEEEVLGLTKSRAVGRLHLALVLQQKGHVSSTGEAFQKYLGENCPTYVAKFKQTPHEAIKLIKDSGGLAVLAHPALTNKDELIPSFVDSGLDGIEVFYPKHSNAMIEYYQGIAGKHKLCMTGGSDAHGRAKKDTFIGKTKIPYELVEQLKLRGR